MQSLMPPIDSSDSLFHDGNPLTGEKGTIVTAEFLNDVQSAVRDTQSELIAILTAAALAPDAATSGQLLTSLKKLFLIRSNPFSDIATDGSAAISKALSNLGLGDGSALPVGVPVPYPLSTPPAGWLKCNGAAFTAAQYPKLALAYPALTLPDLRGEFIRGWDDGRGVDSGRVLLSLQAHAMQQHSHYMYTQGASAGSVWAIIDSTNYSQTNGDSAVGNGTTAGQWSTQTSGAVGNYAAETRPRNVAFNYIVRAA